MKTFGDLLHIKRYENHLTLSQIGRQMGTATEMVREWENGTSTPDQKQWQLLSDILSFDSGMPRPKHQK